MRGAHCRLLAVLTIPALLWLCVSSASATDVTLGPTKGHPKVNVKVTGAGFGANEAVDIYFDTTDVQLAVADGSGNFVSKGVKVPSSAEPGIHWFTAIGRRTGDASQAKFKVQTNWVEFGWNGYGKRNNPFENVIDASNVDHLETAWSQFLGSPITATPATTNGIVYIGSAGVGSAFDEKTGASKGHCGGGNFGTAVAKDIVYSSSYGYVQACKAATGALVWQFEAGLSYYVSSAVVSHGIVYFGTDEGNLYALNAATGAVIWTTSALGPVLSSPAIVNGAPAYTNEAIYVGTYDGQVWALDANGVPFWVTSISGQPLSSPAVSDGRVYIGSNDGNVYALDWEFGDVRWTATTGGAVESSPAVAGNVVYVGSDDGKVYALNKGTGAAIWSTSIGGHVRASPAVANGVVYIASDDNTVYALAATSGAVLWSAVGGGGSYGLASPIVVDGLLLVGSTDSFMYGYALDAGNNALYRRSNVPPPYASLHPNWHLKPAQ